MFENMFRMFIHEPLKPGSISVRLTAAGWGYSVLMLVMFVIGINYANNLVYLLAYCLISFFAVGFLQTRQQVKNLDFQQWHCKPVFAGQDICYQIQVCRQGRSNSWGLYVSEHEIPVCLKSGMANQLQYKCTVHKRGYYQPDVVHICSTYPFGLFQARVTTPGLPSGLVYPKPEGDTALPTIVLGDEAHHQLESESVTSMRPYRQGDNLGRVAWKALARCDQLMTKEFDGAAGDPVLTFDWKLPLAADLNIEARVSQFALWMLEAERSNREFALILSGETSAVTIEAGSGAAHLAECLQALALFHNRAGKMDSDEVVYALA